MSDLLVATQMVNPEDIKTYEDEEENIEMIKYKLNNDALSYSQFIGPLVQIALKGATNFFKTFQ